jgi:hypothetical protein
MLLTFLLYALSGEIIAIYCENLVHYMHKQYRQDADLCDVKVDGKWSNLPIFDFNMVHKYIWNHFRCQVGHVRNVNKVICCV